MGLFNYIFGANRITPSSVPDRVASKVSKKLVSTIVQNPVNDWRFAAFRQYAIYPFFKLAFGPLLIASKGNNYYHRIGMALKTYQSGSVKPFARTLRPAVAALKARYTPFPLISWAIARIFGDTVHKDIANLVGAPYYQVGRLIALSSSSQSSYANASAQSSGIDALKTMKSVAMSSLILARHRMLLFSWTSRLFWAASLFPTYLFIADVARQGMEASYRTLSRSSQSDCLPCITHNDLGIYLTMAIGAWLISLLAGIIHANNSIFSSTEKVAKHLTRTLGLDEEDIKQLEMIATPYTVAVMVASDRVNMSRLNSLKGDWPNKFRPGASIQNPLIEGAFVIAARHPAEPHQFISSDLSNQSDRKRYKEKIIARMKQRLKENNDEWLFCGEVLAPEVWEFRNNFIELKNNPHLVVIGQTRSGKTKSLLSIVYTFAAAYPDTVWYFADGKDGADFENAANHLSAYPVAKIRDQSAGGLVEFANLMHLVFDEFKRRQRLYASAKVNCSSIYEYRDRVGPLPQIIFVVDEFFRFVNEVEYNTNKDTVDSLAGMMRVFLAQGASFGIHMFVATQRYQDTDVPTSMRTNFTAKMTHSVMSKDATFNDIPQNASLQAGQFYLSAQGHFTQYSNVSSIKSALPYIGNSDDAAMEDAHINVEKKSWNNDLEFKISNADDDNSTPKQFERTFASMMKELDRLDISKESGDVDQKAIQFMVPEGPKRIGVTSVLRDHMTPEHVQRIKRDAQALNCDAVLLYVLGIKPTEFKGGKASMTLREANDFGGVKIIGQTIHDLRKDRKNVGLESHGSGGDIFSQRLVFEKILEKPERTESQDSDVHAGPSGEQAGSAEILDKYLKSLQLFETAKIEKMGEISLLTQVRKLPFGSVGVFIVVPSKKRFESALAIAEGLVADAGGDDGDLAVFIVGKDLPKNFKGSKRISTLRYEIIEDTSRRINAEKENDEKVRMGRTARQDLLLAAGLSRTDTKYGLTRCLIGKRAFMLLKGSFVQSPLSVHSLSIQCLITGDTVAFGSPIGLLDYSIKALGIPPKAHIVTHGVPAPIGLPPESFVGDETDQNYAISEAQSQLTIAGGIVTRKSVQITAEQDRQLLESMKDKQPE